MDKSPSVNCQQVDDGSWDADENEISEELLQSLDNLSANSWDSSSERDIKLDVVNEEVDIGLRDMQVEIFKEEEDHLIEQIPSSDSWRSSRTGKKIIQAQERPPFPLSESDSDSLEERFLPDEDTNLKIREIGSERQCDLVQKFIDSTREETTEEECLIEEIEEIRPKLDRREEESVNETENNAATLDRDTKLLKANKIEPFLIVEDLEELDKLEWMENDEKVESESGDDLSVWRIPMTGRADTSDDCSSTYGLIKGLRSFRFVREKSKSEPNLIDQKSSSKKSKSLNNIMEVAPISLKDAVIQFEGDQIKTTKGKKNAETFAEIISMGERPSHYQEIECRTLKAVLTNVKKGDKQRPHLEDNDEEEEEEEERNEEVCNRTVRVMAGTSSKNSDEAAGQADISGAEKSDLKGNHEFRNTMSHTNPCSTKQADNLTESWILLDEMGQSQPVTLMEVNFLLNGRSADAVLQEKKEHFIPKCTILRNAYSDLQVDSWNPLVEESLQHILNEEDHGGEEATKSIGLERKFGNMLLYIQSGVNLTSSVRFIPVDLEMIHMWRQNRENVSPISSEDDARLRFSENVTEETSDNQETSDDLRCRLHETYKSTTTGRRKRNKHSKLEESEPRMADNRKVIESLTADIKQLKMRLEAERSRSSGLEQEIYRLKNKYKSDRSSVDSHRTKSDITEQYKKSNSNYVPEVTSSSLLSIEELDEFGNEPATKDVKSGRSRVTHGQQVLKESPKKKSCVTEENLERQDRLRVANTHEDSTELRKERRLTEDISRKSSSVSMNTNAVVETPSQIFTETSESLDSWFKPRKVPNEQKNITDIIYTLEKENERLVFENMSLKKKLNEISVELDEYSSSCEVQSPGEERRRNESLRNQVCNLKLELENLKSLAKNKEQSYRLKDAIFREELAEKSTSLEELKSTIVNIFREMEESKEKLREIGLTAWNSCSEVAQLNPSDLFSLLKSFMTQLMVKVIDFQKENNVLKKSLQENLVIGNKNSIYGFDRSYDVNFVQEISGPLFGNMPKGEEYYSLMTEKATLDEEVKNLRKENDLLLEYQIEHNKKMKKTTAELREEKSRTESLEKAVKILGVEKDEVSQELAVLKKERSIVENELQVEMKKVTELKLELEKRRSQVEDLEEKLCEATEKLRSLSEKSTLKDKIINELRSSNTELESKESLLAGQIRILTEQLRKIEKEKSDFEEELQSSKQIAEESSRELSEYISHLETVVRNTEASLSEAKDKYNETFKSYIALKKSYENLGKQNEANLMLFNKTKDELESCKKTLTGLEEDSKRTEEAKKQALSDLNTIVKSEREKTETLEKLITERQTLDDEILTLRAKAETTAKAKDKLLKEQKDLMNEIALLKKENNKLGQKYKNVKYECNERTKLLKRLDGRLKDVLMEYNERIAVLEKSVTNIMDKATAYKDTFIERRSEMTAAVRELREQLNAVCIEKMDLENEAANLYTTMKHMQKEMNDKKVKNLNLVKENEKLLKVDEDEVSDRSISSSKSICEDLKKTEMDLAAAHEKIRQLENSKEVEKSKYESIITDLKSQISRYQIRLDIMLKNISAYGRSPEEVSAGKRDEESSKVLSLEQKVRDLSEDLEKKRKRTIELTEVIENNEVEMKKKSEECVALKEKVRLLKEEIRNMTNQFSKLQEFLTSVNKNVETYQKQRDDIAEKLAKSLKVVTEERASKQSTETIFAEKERFFKDQLGQLQASLIEKKADYEALLKIMDEKKELINKLQDDVKKWKYEVGLLKSQLAVMKEQNSLRRDSTPLINCEESENKMKSSLELKEVRALNLELRKKEGVLEAKIVRLEDDLRGSLLKIKELEGDLKNEKMSKSLLTDMIEAARKEIEKCKVRGQIMASIAYKIERHLDMTQASSKDLFSGIRMEGEYQKC